MQKESKQEFNITDFKQKAGKNFIDATCSGFKLTRAKVERFYRLPWRLMYQYQYDFDVLPIKQNSVKNFIDATYSNKIILERSELITKNLDKVTFIAKELDNRRLIEKENGLISNFEQDKELLLITKKFLQLNLIEEIFNKLGNQPTGADELIKLKHLYLQGKGELVIFGIYPQNQSEYDIDVVKIIDEKLTELRAKEATETTYKGNKLIWTGEKGELYGLFYDMIEFALIKETTGFKTAISKLICQNFTTENEGDFSQSTASKALQNNDEGKAKRSKNRIDFSPFL